MPAFYKGSITPNQIKKLIRIYLGVDKTELDFHKQVNPIRSIPDSKIWSIAATVFIMEINQLLDEVKFNQVDDNKPISDEQRQILLNILKNYQSYFVRNSPGHLLFKRLAAIVNFDTKTIVDFNSVYEDGAYVAITILESLFQSSVKFSIPVFAILKLYDFMLGTRIEAITEEEKAGIQRLQSKLSEFGQRLNMNKVPHISLSLGYSVSFRQGIQEIKISRSMLQILDQEEQEAYIAHELVLKEHSFESMSMRALILLTTIISMYLRYVDDSDPNLVHFTISLLLTEFLYLNLYVYPKEKQAADQVARELVGPLAHASSVSTLNRDLKYKNPIGTFFTVTNPHMATLVKENHLDQAFSKDTPLENRL